MFAEFGKKLDDIFNGLMAPRPAIRGNGRHFIMVGRTSHAIAQGIVDEFGHGGRNGHGPLIDRPGPVIQGRFSTFDDGESSAEVFVDDNMLDHPIEQKLSASDKEEIIRQLRGADVTIVHSISGKNTSSRAMSLLHMATHLREEIGVANIRLVAPHLPYMRNDRPFQKSFQEAMGNIIHLRQHNAVSARIYAKQLRGAYISDVTGFEAHSRDGQQAYRQVFGAENSRFIQMGDFFARSIAEDFDRVVDGACQIMVGSPDGMNKPNDYGIARAESFGETLYEGTEFDRFRHSAHFLEKPYMFGISKERFGPKETRITDFKGDVAGKICVLIDDIISSGGTTLQAAEKLKEKGASKVIAIATHAVLTDSALPRLLDSPALDSVMLTDTIPRVVEKVEAINNADKLVVKTISPLVNREIVRYVPRTEPLLEEALTLQAG